MVSAVTKQEGTTFVDFFYSVPFGSENSRSARFLWIESGMKISYETFNRIIGKLSMVQYNNTTLICRRKSGASFLYWREHEKFPEDLRCID